MTPVQSKMLDWVRDYIGRRGFAPSCDEIREGLGYGSKATVWRVLTALEELGHIRRVKNRTRSIELVGGVDLRTVPIEAIRGELARRGLSLDALMTDEPRAFARGSVSCAADCCQLVVEPGNLFCRRHWFQLPRDLRDDIYKAHSRRDRARYQMLVTEARDLIDSGQYQRVLERAG
jgi:hypothetical protein